MLSTPHCQQSCPLGQSIDIGDNPGARELTADDLAIATAKGWTVLY